MAQREKKKWSMRHISRVDQERRRQHGWLVRIMRDGVTHQKFFTDGPRGGKNGSLLSAIAYRDELLRLYPKPARGNMFNRVSVRNKGNPIGLSRTRQIKRGRTYEVWQAGWLLPNGKQVNRKFFFSPDGRSEAEAKALAIKARAKGLKMIERMRKGQQPKREAGRHATKKRRAVVSD